MPFVRSLLFNVAFFVLTAVWCVGLLLLLPFPRRMLMAGVETYMHVLTALERLLLGLRYRVEGRGNLPDGSFIVAAKHQSTWETMKLHLLVDDPAIVLKQELMWLPLWGWFAARAGMIPVRRGGSGAAAAMLVSARARKAEGRPIVIFPQGTRVAPGERRPYRAGVAALYEGLGLPVVPLALNSGLFWGRRSFVKRPGTITVRFLPPIPPGLPRAAMMSRLERELEAESDRLAALAGAPATAQ